MDQHTTAVRDWMTREPVTVREDMPLLNAYQLMHQYSIRRLPVLNEQGLLCGIITRSDIQQVIPFAENADDRVDALFALVGMVVQEIMTRNPVASAPNDSIRTVALAMINAKISGVPVVDQGHVVGIITESDIFRMVAEAWADYETAVEASR